MDIDKINFLPDTIANQIAAGEVVQRPASVVKELVENAIDAEATQITVNIKDAGKTLIQVVDNGIGMSETDARMCFERHATSKIKDVNDLFNIRTMGFRGEALASIASIAEVELKTRREGEELGTRVVMEGGKLVLQEKISCAKGSNFAVKKLFYNVPARRKFLRKDTTEFGLIMHEVQKVAIAYHNIRFELYHNDKPVYILYPGNLAKRISDIFGDKMKKEILPVEVNLPGVIRIYGYIGKPATSKKKSSQFFFVNNRFFRHNWFHKAIVETYSDLISPETSPAYFLFFEIDPQKIDVNIHPTKTEIKFEDEVNIRKALVSAIKNALYKYNIFPGLDFDRVIDIPSPPSKFEQKNEKTNFPTHTHNKTEHGRGKSGPSFDDIQEYMKIVYEDNEAEPEQKPENEGVFIFESSLNETADDLELVDNPKYIVYKDRYIITEAKSGLLVIDATKALEAINFNEALKIAKGQKIKSQFVLQPLNTGIIVKNSALYEDFKEAVKRFGFDITIQRDEILINAYPSLLKDNEAVVIVEDLFRMFEEGVDTEDENILVEKIAYQWAKTSAVITNIKTLEEDGIKKLVSSLFELDLHDKTITGEKIMDILSHDLISDLFNK